ncbi:unnamed protein product [Calicophoron daubneyi]|uniref:Rho-GAP domain-containing protein n=1 Tax=Calicophoron daubneyi TaxID=300641 RepID=A0AAV2TDG6_CALDB
MEEAKSKTLSLGPHTVPLSASVQLVDNAGCLSDAGSHPCTMPSRPQFMYASAARPNPTKSVKKLKSGFRLPGTKKHRKEQKVKSSLLGTDSTEPASLAGDTQMLTASVPAPSQGESVKSSQSVGLCPSTVSRKEAKREKRLKKKLQQQQQDEDRSHHTSSSKGKRKRELKLDSSKSHTQSSTVPTKPLFGVLLDVACSRSPSHDGVPLPGFFRHCIDYIERNGLSSEGIYRVPGVNSQVQALISSLDRGEEFPLIAPTSAAFYQQDMHKSAFGSRGPHFSSGYRTAADVNAKPRMHPSNSGHSSYNASYLTKGFVGSPVRLSGHPAQAPESRVVGSHSGTCSDIATAHLPHDLAVVASVIKHFLRNLPEPVLTNKLRAVMEEIPTNGPEVYTTLSKLVHQELPRPHRYLLAWMLQHITHIVDRSGENLMSLANISIVLSPCLGISHRLLAILLNPAPSDFQINLNELDPTLPTLTTDEPNVDPSSYHWLFPHPAYLLRPYHPPLRPAPDLELPETNAELDLELQKQESLLLHLHDQIGRGDTDPDKESLLWEVQHLVTEIKRRKTLVDPEGIRAELLRQEAQLDRLHKAIAESAMGQSRTATNDLSSSSQQTGFFPDSSTQRRRGTQSDKSAAKAHANSIPSYADELWAVQRQITMLKRRLKQQEKMVSQVASSKATTDKTENTTSEPQSDSHANPMVVKIPGVVPLNIPSLSELDQEEVLNLSLRRLPVDVSPTNAQQPQVTLPQPGTELKQSESVSKVVKLDSTVTTASEFPHTKDGKQTEPMESSEEVADDAKDIPVVIEAPKQESEIEPANSLSKPIDEETTHTEELVGVQHIETSDKVQYDVEERTVRQAPDKTVERSDDKIVTAEPNNTPTTTTPQPYTRDQIIQPLPSSPWRILDSASTAPQRQVLQQVAFYTARKQELNAIHADLRARIRSENAEIRRLESCINHLLETGGKRVQRIYDAQFSAIRLCPPSASSPVTEHSSVWLSQSWTKLAENLNTESYPGVSGENDACLISGESERSDSSEESEELLPVNGSAEVVAYTRLNDESDDRSSLDGRPPPTRSSPKSPIPLSSSSEGRVASGPSRIHTLGIDEGLEELCDDDEDEDEEEDEGEADLARTLHQLTLDNARLEQLNARYFEGIQAERNRCAELKVLLRLRCNTVACSMPFASDSNQLLDRPALPNLQSD